MNDMNSSDGFRDKLMELKKVDPDAYERKLSDMADKFYSYYKTLTDDDTKKLGSINYAELYKQLKEFKANRKRNFLTSLINKQYKNNSSNPIYNPKTNSGLVDDSIRSKNRSSNVDPKNTYLGKITFKHLQRMNHADNVQRESFLPAAYVESI